MCRFVLWACGHDHQEESDGRVQTCRPDVEWFILEWSADDVRAAQWPGLLVGDLTLHVRSTIDGTYSPARALIDDARRAAGDLQRPLLILHNNRWCH